MMLDQQVLEIGQSDRLELCPVLSGLFGQDELEPLIPPAKRGGRRREVNVREVLNAIFYVLSTGCQWQALPKESGLSAHLQSRPEVEATLASHVVPVTTLRAGLILGADMAHVIRFDDHGDRRRDQQLHPVCSLARASSSVPIM